MWPQAYVPVQKVAEAAILLDPELLHSGCHDPVPPHGRLCGLGDGQLPAERGILRMDPAERFAGQWDDAAPAQQAAHIERHWFVYFCWEDVGHAEAKLLCGLATLKAGLVRHTFCSDLFSQGLRLSKGKRPLCC